MESNSKFTFPLRIVKQRSLKICTSGLVGYLKLTCCSSISPFTVSSVIPESSLGSTFDFLSRIANMEAAAALALLESGANELDWEIPIAAVVRAKKTCQVANIPN